MTIQQLYEDLKFKEYPGPRNDTFIRLLEEAAAEGVNVLEAPEKEYVLKLILESDRREVFLYWYGPGLPDRDNGLDKTQWEFKLRQADEDYRRGFIQTTIDFILTKETNLEQLP
jgi:hypothetical protein